MKTVLTVLAGSWVGSCSVLILHARRELREIAALMSHPRREPEGGGETGEGD